MGVKLLGKIKIHEIAKKLDLTSKEIIERAKKLGIEVKNHLSSIEDTDETKIEESFKSTENGKKEKKDSEKKQAKKEKKDGHVIIRREVIISEEEIAKKEAEEAKKKKQAKKEVGFVERNANKDFNIVYREKPAKPMTVSELFGLKSKKEEEPK